MLERGCGTELSTRSDGADLPPASLPPGGGSPISKRVELIRAEAEDDTWRIVDLFSRTGLPFDVELHWSAGSGQGAKAVISVARCARIAVFASTLRILVSNQAGAVNRVAVTIADGYAATHNQWELAGRHFASSSPKTISIPPFADFLRLDLADPALAPAALIRVLDAFGIVRAAYTVDDQPPTGIPLGGAGSIELALASDIDFRAVYHLSL